MLSCEHPGLLRRVAPRNGANGERTCRVLPDCVESALRQKANFSNKFKLICPVQSLAQKYFGFSETQITFT
jgi:hypothetical protein